MNAVPAIGPTPISPVKIELGTVETPALARMTKLPAVPRRTGAWPVRATAPVVKRYTASASIALPAALVAPVLIVAV